MEGPHPGANAHTSQVLLLAAGRGGSGRGDLAALVLGLLASWPELAELRRCSPRCTAAHRWSQALSGLTAGARAALDGALLAQRARLPGIPLGEEVNLATMVLQGTACYEGVSALLHGGLRAVAAAWRMDPERVADAEARLSLVVGPPTILGWGAVPAWGRVPVDGGSRPFPLAVLLFGAALRAGWAWSAVVAGPEALCRPQGGLALRQWPRVHSRAWQGGAPYGAGYVGSLVGQPASLADGPGFSGVCLL